MKDIARDLGVSVMTVSKVIRNHSDIGEETRKRVLQRIRELNYTPNAAAQALVTGRSYVMGLIVPDLVHPFFGELAKGISAVLRSKGYSLVISSSEEDPKLEENEIEHLLGRGVDALLIASVQREATIFAKIEARGIPYIMLDRKVPGVKASFIGVDDELIGRLATEHLVKSGCRRIAHIAGSSVSSSQGRRRGYEAVLTQKRLKRIPEYVVERTCVDDLGTETGYEAMRKLLQQDPRPDGVFCVNDPTAMGAMRAILEAGLSIPEDIAIIGCGDVQYARFLQVPLSTVSQQTSVMGQKAGQLALALVSKKNSRSKSLLVEPRLEIRRSTARNRAASANP